MAQTVSVIVSAEERVRLAAIVGDRSRPLKHVQRARIVLHSADRLPVLAGMAAEFAAGDVAWLPIDGLHSPVISCQRARPMGAVAGYTVGSDLLGLPRLPLAFDW